MKRPTRPHAPKPSRPSSRPHPSARPKAAERPRQAARPMPEGGHRIVVLHKPFDVLSQFTVEVEGQRTLADFGLPAGLYPAGRLDRDSEGLLLLSDDGRFIKRLLDPEQGHPRTYYVQVEGIPTPEALEALRNGVDIRVGKETHRTRPALIEVLGDDPDLPPRDPPIRYRAAIPTSWVSITLTEGKNRQVRRMTAAVGFPTLRLVRVAIGRLALGDLGQGMWREVTRADILG